MRSSWGFSRATFSLMPNKSCNWKMHHIAGEYRCWITMDLLIQGSQKKGASPHCPNSRLKNRCVLSLSSSHHPRIVLMSWVEGVTTDKYGASAGWKNSL